MPPDFKQNQRVLDIEVDMQRTQAVLYISELDAQDRISTTGQA